MGSVDVGILVIEEQLAKAIPENRLRVMEEEWHGILLVLPSPEGFGGEEDYAERLVRRAIGYHVRLRI
jgi:V/A-type H+/Na+-transporting ATPase subunit F